MLDDIGAAAAQRLRPRRPCRIDSTQKELWNHPLSW